MLSLRFAEETYWKSEDGFEHLVFQPLGKLILTEPDTLDEDGELAETQIGRFSLTIFDIEGASEQGVSVFDLFDIRSETMDCFEALFDSDTEDFSAEVLKQAFDGEYPLRPNLALLERLEIFEGYRGKGFGLTASDLIFSRFKSSVGLFATKPYPLQFEAGFTEERTEEPRLGTMCFGLSQKAATTKLRRHYGRLGFKQVRGTEYMVMDSSKVSVRR